MKKTIYKISLLFLFIPLLVNGQKPAIDLAAMEKWPASPRLSISNNGKYTCYIYQSPVGVSVAVVQSLQNDWKIEIPHVTACSLTPDNRQYLLIKQDSLYIGELNEGKLTPISLATSFQVFTNDKNQARLIYTEKKTGLMVIRNLQTGAERCFTSSDKYWVSRNGNTVIVEIYEKVKPKLSNELIWLDIETNKSRRIWKGQKIKSLIINAQGTSTAFSVNHDLWYFEASSDTAAKLLDEWSPELKPNIKIEGVSAIDVIDHRVSFAYSFKDTITQKKKAKGVNIWSYKDVKLQSQQISELNNNTKYQFAAIDTKDNSILYLGNAEINVPSYPLVGKQNYLLVSEAGEADAGEWNWNPLSNKSIYLMSPNDGSKRPLGAKKNILWSEYSFVQISPQQKYVIYFNTMDRNYYSYNVASNSTRNLTRTIKKTWTSYDRNDEPASDHYTLGVAGFTEGDSSVLIYDQQDIFQFDLSGKKAAINLTNDYGKKYNIVFHIADRRISNLRDGKKLLLTAFDRNTKDEGFFMATVGIRKNPSRLIMQPYKFRTILKARDSDSYLIERMNASESPNWFYTTDFITFKQLTYIEPQEVYNWIKSELVNFRTLDGRMEQGVLYKPENFHVNKKYPIIFQYYERKSNAIHQFNPPKVFGAELDIPFFVSNGYLVFTPDIHYQIGHPGKSAYNTIMGAANHLSRFSWVDSSKMGLQGHSFGGFETLYLITHTHRFAAAMAGSPMSDFISAYGSIIGGGVSRQKQYELYRDRIGATPWKRPDLYIENSPVLKADKITTPLLMMSNDKDNDVPFTQGVEMFTAMRRLKKKAWMIQYEDEDHWAQGDNRKDLTIRVKQFFDHYLKGAPPPHWMTDGIPASMKGVDDGLALDTSGKTP